MLSERTLTDSHRDLRLWLLLQEAGERMHGIGVQLRRFRHEARETARVEADATSPEARRRIALLQEVHLNVPTPS